jgi:predicted RecB family endonuclease
VLRADWARQLSHDLGMEVGGAVVLDKLLLLGVKDDQENVLITEL